MNEQKEKISYIPGVLRVCHAPQSHLPTPWPWAPPGRSASHPDWQRTCPSPGASRWGRRKESRHVAYTGTVVPFCRRVFGPAILSSSFLLNILQWYQRHACLSSTPNFIYKAGEDDPESPSPHGSGLGLHCLQDPNDLLCYLSLRQRPLLLAQVFAKFPTHRIWNVLFVLLKPLLTQLLFTHTWIFLNHSVIICDSACHSYLLTAFSHPLRTSWKVLRLDLQSLLIRLGPRPGLCHKTEALGKS